MFKIPSKPEEAILPSFKNCIDVINFLCGSGGIFKRAVSFNSFFATDLIGLVFFSLVLLL